MPNDWLFSVISLTTISVVFGAGMAWGLNKKQISSNTFRIKCLEDNHKTLEASLEQIDDEVQRLIVLLTGATGNNGLVGDMKQIKDRVEGISDLVVAICTKMDIPIRRAFK